VRRRSNFVESPRVQQRIVGKLDVLDLLAVLENGVSQYLAAFDRLQLDGTDRPTATVAYDPDSHVPLPSLFLTPVVHLG